MKVLINMFLSLLFAASLTNPLLARSKTVTYFCLNPDMVIEVNRENNRLYVYDHILNANSVFEKLKGSLYINQFGDEIIWRNSRELDFRPKKWRNFIRLNVVRNADIVIEVTKIKKGSRENNINTQDKYCEVITNLAILEGTWESQSPNKTLVLLATRDGFKVKFTGQAKWTNFYSTDQENTFNDSTGNRYFFDSYNEAIWHSRDNGFFVNIRKVSNELRY